MKVVILTGTQDEARDYVAALAIQSGAWLGPDDVDAADAVLLTDADLVMELPTFREHARATAIHRKLRGAFKVARARDLDVVWETIPA